MESEKKGDGTVAQNVVSRSIERGPEMKGATRKERSGELQKRKDLALASKRSTIWETRDVLERNRGWSSSVTGA